MEDFLLKEIDKLGEMLMLAFKKLGLCQDETPNYSLDDVKDEFEEVGLTMDVDVILKQENPVWYLVEKEKLSDKGLETMIDILVNSDIAQEKKKALLADAIAYLDGKGYYSFRLHSLSDC